MTIKTFKNGEEYGVKFAQGTQTFELGYVADTKKEAKWVAEMLKTALTHFAESEDKEIKIIHGKRF